MEQYASKFKFSSVLVSKYIFYLILLFLPTQFGKHFWPSFSFIYGLRVDYFSPTIYLTDILIGLLFAIWFLSKFGSRKVLNLKFQILNLKLIGLVVFLLAGILFSKNPQVGFYGLIKLFEYIFFGFYVAKNIKDLKLISIIFSLGVFFEGSLTIFQYFNQGSLGGLFYFFGERSFNSQTPGIANASLNGELVLRPYGTFSHPNVLAGYLAIALAIAISNIRKVIYFTSIAIGTFGLFLTLSRVAIFLWILILIINLFSSKNKELIIGVSLLMVIIFIIFIPLSRDRFTSINFSDQSISRRIELTEASFVMIQKNPIFGVGMNNFLLNLPYVQKAKNNSIFEYLQPVHNVYILIFAETGLVGLAAFLWFLIKTYYRISNDELRIKKRKSVIHNPKFIILSMVLTIGFFDHYFLTLQQGQLLFSFVLGFCWAKNSYKIK